MNTNFGINPITKREQAECPICGDELYVNQIIHETVYLNGFGDEIDQSGHIASEIGVCRKCNKEYLDENHSINSNDGIIWYSYITDSYMIVKDMFIRKWIDKGEFKRGD